GSLTTPAGTSTIAEAKAPRVRFDMSRVTTTVIAIDFQQLLDPTDHRRNYLVLSEKPVRLQPHCSFQVQVWIIHHPGCDGKCKGKRQLHSPQVRYVQGERIGGFFVDKT